MLRSGQRPTWRLAMGACIGVLGMLLLTRDFALAIASLPPPALLLALIAGTTSENDVAASMMPPPRPSAAS